MEHDDDDDYDGETGEIVRECVVDVTIENYSSSSPLGRQHYKHEMVS